MSTEKPGCLAALFGLKTKQAPERNIQPRTFPYRLANQFFSPAEADFFRVLQPLVGGHLLICPKVGLKEFLSVTDQANFQSHFNRIDRKHVDFLLCDPKTLQPVFAIELDDSSHRQGERGQRDTFLETVLAAANLPLVRIPVRSSYDPQELQSLFRNAFQKRTMRVAAQENEKRQKEASVEPPLCPTHRVPMVIRTARQGINAGQKFWGCPKYPDCREKISSPS